MDRPRHWFSVSMCDSACKDSPGKGVWSTGSRWAVQLACQLVGKARTKDNLRVIFLNRAPVKRHVWIGSRIGLEKAMATHSTTLAWKIPWTEEPGGPQSMGSLRVGHDWVTSLSLFTFMHWRRKWQPTPVFLPGESQGWGSLVGCCLWGCTESGTTEAT